MNKKQLKSIQKIMNAVIEDLKEDQRLLEFLQSGGAQPGLIKELPLELSQRYRERFNKFAGKRTQLEIINFNQDSDEL